MPKTCLFFFYSILYYVGTPGRRPGRRTPRAGPPCLKKKKNVISHLYLQPDPELQCLIQCGLLSHCQHLAISAHRRVALPIQSAHSAKEWVDCLCKWGKVWLRVGGAGYPFGWPWVFLLLEVVPWPSGVHWVPMQKRAPVLIHSSSVGGVRRFLACLPRSIGGLAGPQRGILWGLHFRRC